MIVIRSVSPWMERLVSFVHLCIYLETQRFIASELWEDYARAAERKGYVTRPAGQPFEVGH